MDAFLYCFTLLDALQNASFMGPELLLCLCVLMARNKKVIQEEEALSRVRGVNDALTSHICSPVLTAPPAPATILLVLCLVAQSCPTLCDPMDCSPPGSMGILQARILE